MERVAKRHLQKIKLMLAATYPSMQQGMGKPVTPTTARLGESHTYSWVGSDEYRYEHDRSDNKTYVEYLLSSI